MKKQLGGLALATALAMALAAAALLPLAPAASAQQKNQQAPAAGQQQRQQQQLKPLHVRNAGGRQCQQFNQVFSSQGNAGAKTAFLQWLAGYATASARMNGVIDVFPIRDTIEFVRFVALVCAETPKATLEYGALRSVLRLRPFWVKKDPTFLTLTWQDGKTQFFREATRALQEHLARAGAKIAIDGIYGNQTGSAILAVSKRYGIGNTPFPTGPLLYVLTRPAGQSGQ